MRKAKTVGALVLAAALLGCEEPQPDPPAATEVAEVEPVQEPQEDTTAVEEQLSLRAIMQQLAAELGALSYGLWLEDFESMELHAAAIAEHAGISPEEVQRIQATLGAEMEQFQELDERVHLASVRMHEAAEARELDAFVDAFVDVQRGCVSCHSEFRERLRSTRP